MSKTKLSKKEKMDARVMALSRSGKGQTSDDREDKTANNGHAVVVTKFNNRTDYLAAHPEEKKLHELHISKFQSGIDAMVHGDADVDADMDRIIVLWKAKKMDEARALLQAVVTRRLPLNLVLNALIIKAENAREIGQNLLDWQLTLPGGKLTPDLYEQHKHELVDARGQSYRFELLEWFMRMAREEKSEINTFLTAIRYKQPLLLATGEQEFELQAERPAQTAVLPPDPSQEMMKLFEPKTWRKKWDALKANPHYYRDGKIVASMRHLVEASWRETFAVVDEVKEALA